MDLKKVKLVGIKLVSSISIVFRFEVVDGDHKGEIIESSFSLNGKGFHAYTLKFLNHASLVDQDGWLIIDNLKDYEFNIKVEEKVTDTRTYLNVTTGR